MHPFPPHPRKGSCLPSPNTALSGSIPNGPTIWIHVRHRSIQSTRMSFKNRIPQYWRYPTSKDRFFIQVSNAPELPEEQRFDLEKYIGYDYLFLGDTPSSHAKTRVLAPKYDRNASENVASWFDGLFSEPGGAEKLIHPKGAVGVNVHMDDPRVREWTPEEVNSIREWMNQGQAIVQLKDVVKVCSQPEFGFIYSSVIRILLLLRTRCKVGLWRWFSGPLQIPSRDHRMPLLSWRLSSRRSSTSSKSWRSPVPIRHRSGGDEERRNKR